MRERRDVRLDERSDPYPVLLARGLLDRLGPELVSLWRGRRLAVVTHHRLFRLFGERLLGTLARAGLEPELLVIPEGERAKSLATVERLYGRLIRKRFGREDGIVAFGGGVVGDVAGFVAATFLRGIDYVQVPTSLLAQIDSSLGAKVGVNHPLGKNLVGAIYRPRGVFIDPELLATLPPRQFRSGLFELLKYGFIGSPWLFRRMERDPALFQTASPELDRAVALAVRMKLAVVREDEREAGRRRILNFGHTLGHGLEAAGEFRRLTHGEAVGWGMIGAARLAERSGRIDRDLAGRMERAVRGLAPLPDVSRFPLETVMSAVEKDKKIGADGFRFVLPTGIGSVEVANGFPREEILWALRSLGLGSGSG